MSDEWIEQARRMREQKVTYDTIAKQLGVSVWKIRWALLPDPRKDQRRQQINDRRKGFIVRNSTTHSTGARIDTMAICRRFAAGEIDRAELSRQLRGA